MVQGLPGAPQIPPAEERGGARPVVLAHGLGPAAGQVTEDADRGGHAHTVGLAGLQAAQVVQEVPRVRRQVSGLREGQQREAGLRGDEEEEEGIGGQGTTRVSLDWLFVCLCRRKDG